MSGELLIKMAQAFATLSLISIGGVNAPLPEIRRQVVDVQGWMDNATFAHLFAISNALPRTRTVGTSSPPVHERISPGKSQPIDWYTALWKSKNSGTDFVSANGRKDPIQALSFRHPMGRCRKNTYIPARARLVHALVQIV